MREGSQLWRRLSLSCSLGNYGSYNIYTSILVSALRLHASTKPSHSVCNAFSSAGDAARWPLSCRERVLATMILLLKGLPTVCCTANSNAPAAPSCYHWFSSPATQMGETTVHLLLLRGDCRSSGRVAQVFPFQPHQRLVRLATSVAYVHASAQHDEFSAVDRNQR